MTVLTRESGLWTYPIIEILVLIGGAIPPVPALPASTRISAMLKRVLGHSSPVNVGLSHPKTGPSWFLSNLLVFWALLPSMLHAVSRASLAMLW